MALQDRYKSSYGRGSRPNFEKCCKEVYGPEVWSYGHQCTRANGHGPDGAYCKTHDPVAVEAKQKAREDKWAIEREIARKKNQLQSNAASMLEIIRQIAKGHNDPRQLCADFLREKQFEDE